MAMKHHTRRTGTQESLIPPRIYGAQDGGLGYDDLLGTPDARIYVVGQTVLLDIPATGELYWDDVLLGEPIPIPAGTQTPTFSVPGSLIAGSRKPGEDGYTGDGEHTVTYLYRYNDGIDTSEPSKVRVKCSLPGGEDPVGSTRDINENLVAPTVTPDPVPDDPGVIVTVAFPRWKNIATGDVVTVEWAGYKYPLPPVTDPDQAQLPVATLHYDDIARAGGGEHVPVSYYIYDVAHNWSKYAPYADPSVEIDPGTLPAPQIVEAVDNLLDLEALGDKDVTVRVGTRQLVIDDIVTVSWTGTDASGGKDEYSPASQTFADENVFVLDFVIPNAHAVAAAGGSVAVSYLASIGGVSKTRRYRVGGLPVVLLDPPIVPQASNGELDPFVAEEIQVNAPFAPKHMLVGDTVTIYVIAKRGATSRVWQDSVVLTSGDLVDPLPFFCPADVLRDVDNGQAAFRYDVASRNTVRESRVLTLIIRSQGAQPDLPSPIVDKVQNGILDPDTAFATVEIPASYATAPKTAVTLLWSGKVSYTTTGNVADDGSPPSFRVIGENYIKGNEETEVAVTYVIDSNTSGAARFTVSKHRYEMIIGARSGAGPYYYANPSLLSARTAQDDDLEWSYDGGAVYHGSRHLDNHPERSLTVRDGVRVTTLRPRNVAGIFSYTSSGSGCALLDNGGLYGWGDPLMRPPGGLVDVTQLAQTRSAYAAVKKDGSVEAWGESAEGGNIPTMVGTRLAAVVRVIGSSRAFLAILADGSATVWGDRDAGGEIPPLIAPELHDIVDAAAADMAFAVRRADGEVFCWGGEDLWPNGMHVHAAQGATMLRAANRAFSALLPSGIPVAWGDPIQGGSIPAALTAQITDVIQLSSTSQAFAALTMAGKVFCWGEPIFGGTSPALPFDAAYVCGSTTAFVAVAADLTTRAWGQPAEGGTVPPALEALSIVPGHGSFAAITPTFDVTAWGLIKGSLETHDAVAVYAAGSHFVVLTSAGEVKAIGNSAPDLSGLKGKVTHSFYPSQGSVRKEHNA